MRTTVRVDGALLERVTTLYPLCSSSEVVEMALRRLLGEDDRLAILELTGIGWDGDLDELRRSRNISW